MYNYDNTNNKHNTTEKFYNTNNNYNILQEKFNNLEEKLLYDRLKFTDEEKTNPFIDDLFYFSLIEFGKLLEDHKFITPEDNNVLSKKKVNNIFYLLILFHKNYFQKN